MLFYRDMHVKEAFRDFRTVVSGKFCKASQSVPASEWGTASFGVNVFAAIFGPVSNYVWVWLPPLAAIIHRVRELGFML